MAYFECKMKYMTLRSDIFSMFWPVYALDGKSKGYVDFEYRGISLTITSSEFGRATVKDKEVIIYCLSHLMAAQNMKIEINRKVLFCRYDFLKTTNRGTSGKDYKILDNALKRLKGTRLTTDATISDIKIPEDTSMIEDFRKVQINENVYWEVTLPEWLFAIVENRKVLKLDDGYFNLNPFERRLYEICKKCCGRKPSYEFPIDNMKKRIGVKLTKSQFKRRLRRCRRLLGLGILFDDKDVLIFNLTAGGSVLFKGRAKELGIEFKEGEDEDEN